MTADVMIPSDDRGALPIQLNCGRGATSGEIQQIDCRVLAHKRDRREPIGDFTNRRGEFFDQEALNGRAIFVRSVIAPVTADSCRFEEAYSDDGGKGGLT